MDIAKRAAEGDGLREQLVALTSRCSELEQQIEKLSSERERYRALYLELLELNQRLERGLLGPKGERLSADDLQLTLAILGQLLEPRASAPDPETEGAESAPPAKPRPQSSGRRPLPSQLPTIEIEIIPDEVQHEGLDAYVRIGEEVSEVVEKRPASLVNVRVRRPKFIRKEDRERGAAIEVTIAEVQELPIERGLAGPGLLADTLVRRFSDHLPLHRLESIYAREGMSFSRSTLCGWHDPLRALVDPLVEAMWEDAKTAPYLCTDATGVLVQARERCRRGHFFVVVAPERHVLFRYSPKHDAKAVEAMLAGYQGYLVADAHSVYEHLYASGEVIEVGCWAHARRYFFKALGTDPERARTALAHLQGLFQIERRLAEVSKDERRRVRDRESRPRVERFFAWCEAQVHEVLDGTPIAAGVRYARNQRRALERFLEDPRLPLTNNVSERALRREAVGRKNWLFVGSDEGAEVNAVFVSLLASCQLHGIEPWAYLRDLLCLLPRWPRRRVLELAPLHWQKTLEQPQTQQHLAANVFRQVTLGDSIR